MSDAETFETKEAFVGIMAHNEEENMDALLDRVSGEDPPGIFISRIIVVSSGSTDGTDDIVRRHHARDHRIALITQDKRYGKCAAINLFLDECPPKCLVALLSGDILPEPGALTALLGPLLEPGVGMTGGRPMPVNDRNRFFGFACHLIWEIHHRVALLCPKLGEAVAFRKTMDAIPEDLAVDEAALESMILAKGLELRYCPDAIIRNRGPDNLTDFLMQRRRIQVGHMDLHRKTGYKVSTFGLGPAFLALLGAVEWRPRPLLWTFFTCLLVIWGRVLGAWDHHVLRRRHAVWDIAESTKGALSKKLTRG